MGVNISVASPLPDGVSLENFNGSWRIKPAKIPTKVWEYTLPAPVGTATEHVFNTDVRPTLDFTKDYYFKIETFTNAGGVSISGMALFCNATGNTYKLGSETASPINPTNLAERHIPLIRTIDTTANSFDLMISCIDWCRYFMKNEANTLRIKFNATNVISDLKVSLWEVDCFA